MEHHVYFWLKDEHRNDSDRAAFEGGLRNLFEIPGAERGTAARPADVPDRPVTDKTWDYALSIPFASVAAHDHYQQHADHDRFVETFSQLWAKVEVRDLKSI